MSDADLQTMMVAVQTQIYRDWAPIWMSKAQLQYVPTSGTPTSWAWQLFIFDTSDQAGALGYHDVGPTDVPIGKVFAKTDLDSGYSVSVTISHETLEMLLDPWINLTAQMGSDFWAYEACDPCEDDSLGYLINGVNVSDFLLPPYFQQGHAGPWDFKRHMTAAQVLPGGYQGVYTNGGWTQITKRGQGREIPGHEGRRDRRLRHG